LIQGENNGSKKKEEKGDVLWLCGELENIGSSFTCTGVGEIFEAEGFEVVKEKLNRDGRERGGRPLTLEGKVLGFNFPSVGKGGKGVLGDKVHFVVLAVVVIPMGLALGLVADAEFNGGDHFEGGGPWGEGGEEEAGGVHGKGEAVQVGGGVAGLVLGLNIAVGSPIILGEADKDLLVKGKVVHHHAALQGRVAKAEGLQGDLLVLCLSLDLAGGLVVTGLGANGVAGLPLSNLLLHVH